MSMIVVCPVFPLGKIATTVLGHFPQTVAPSMNWREAFMEDNLMSSLQPSGRF